MIQVLQTPDDIEVAQMPFVGGGNDVDSPQTNVTVGAGGGSATMVTPLLGITACHVIDSGSTGTNIRVGANGSGQAGDRAAVLPVYTPLAECLKRSGDAEPSALVAEDYGAFKLNEGMSQASWLPLMELDYQKPSFARPPVGGNGQPTVPIFTSGYGGGRAIRQVATVTAPLTRHDGEALNSAWSFPGPDQPATTGGVRSEGGDSGGPLFYSNNGRRDVFGVVSGRTCDASPEPDPAVYEARCDAPWAENITTWYSDITAPVTATFLRGYFIDTSRTSLWKTAHGFASNYAYWYGELGYYGPCRGDDSDCDRWVDDSDNCPYLFNPMQSGGENGGAGSDCACPNDAAQGSADIDGDGLCVFDSIGRVTDNCPNVANPDQLNCNEFSEATLGKPLLGDACDPVPCPRVTRVDGNIGYIERTCVEKLGYEICATAKQNDTFHLEPQGAGQGSGVIVSDMPARGALVEAVPTSMHFCKPSDSPRIVCGSAEVIRDDAVTYERRFREPVTQTLPWVLASRRTAGASSTAAVELDYGEGSPSIQWDFFADAARWSSQGWIEQPPLCLATKEEAGRCLAGVIAFHAQTEVGKTVRILPNGVEVGFHGGVSGGGKDLSNTFTTVTPIDNAISLRWYGVVPADPLGEIRRDPRLAGVMIRTLADPLPGPEYRGPGEWTLEPAHDIALIDFGVDIGVTYLGPTLQQRTDATAAGIPVRFTPELRSGRALLSPAVANFVRTSTAAAPTTRWLHSDEPRAGLGGDVALVLAPTALGASRPLSVRTTSRGSFALANELGEASTFSDPARFGSRTPWLSSPTAQFVFLPTVKALFAVEAGHLAQYRAGEIPNAEVELYATSTQATLRSVAYVSSANHSVANLWVARDQAGRFALSRYSWTNPLQGAGGSWGGGPSQLAELTSAKLPVAADAGRLLPGPVQGNGGVFLLACGDDQLLVVRNVDGQVLISALNGNGANIPFSSTILLRLIGQSMAEPVLDASGLHLRVARTTTMTGPGVPFASTMSLRTTYSSSGRLTGLAP